jgi:hypothetical protein
MPGLAHTIHDDARRATPRAHRQPLHPNTPCPIHPSILSGRANQVGPCVPAWILASITVRACRLITSHYIDRPCSPFGRGWGQLINTRVLICQETN